MPVKTFGLENVCVRFNGHIVLSDITCAFKASSWTHIIGPNGAGKSTLLRVLCGLLEPDEGSVSIDAHRLSAMNAAEKARLIAYVPQRLEALPSLRVIDFVMQGTFAWLKSESSNDALQNARDALASLEISSFENRRLSELSGGEQQLCVLASAIAQKAQVILLDEPTSALDIRFSEIFCSALQNLTRKGVTIISTTHDLQIARRFADQTLLLSEGKCLWFGDGFPDAENLAAAYQLDSAYFKVGSVPGSMPEVRKISEKAEPVRTISASRVIVISAVLVAVIALICPFLGATWTSPDDEIFWMLRLPRVIWGGVAGAVLALVGASLQALFQNALATPYTLGIASGSSLGAMIAIQCGIVGVFGLPVCAAVGGFASLLAVLGIASRFGLREPIYCLLAGVAASMFCSALGLVIQAFAAPMTAQQMMRWQLGGLEIVGYDAMLTIPVIVLTCFGLFWLCRPLELLSVDVELAAARGVCVERTRVIALVCAGIATSVVVSICGPIGFVGLIIPNAVRKICGAGLKKLFPISALCGAGFLMLADTLSRVLERIAWIPVGVVTAVIGAPIFIFALFKRK